MLPTRPRPVEPLHVQFLSDALLDDRDPRFLRRDVDQDLFVHRPACVSSGARPNLPSS